MANLVDQTKALEDKIRAAIEVARTLRTEKAALAQELEAAKKRVAEAQAAKQEISELRSQLQAAAQENQALKAERDDVRKRVDAMLSSMAELEELAAVK